MAQQFTHISKKTLIHTDTCIPMFIEAFFFLQFSRHGSNLRVHQQMNKDVVCIYTMEYYSVIRFFFLHLQQYGSTWTELC